MTSKLFFRSCSIQELLDSLYKATVQEFSVDKPGNIGPNQTYKGMTVQHFQKAIEAIVESAAKFSQLPLGEFIFRCVEGMVSAQDQGNLLLGQILLNSPLFIAGLKLMKTPFNPQQRTWEIFWEEVNAVLEYSDEVDGVWLYRAIRLCEPGGLENPGGEPIQTKYDFTKSDIDQLILEDKKPFKALFYESAEFDTISKEIISNYKICRKFITDWVIPNQNKYGSTSELTLMIFLKILSDIPDSLIFRKNDQKTAERVQNSAVKIIKNGSFSTNIGKKLIHTLNQELMASNGKLNPGTTADLTACILFLCFIFGIIEH